MLKKPKAVYLGKNGLEFDPQSILLTRFDSAQANPAAGIDLSMLSITKIEADQLDLVTTWISKHVETVNLSYNSIGKLNVQEWRILCDFLENILVENSKVKTINLSHNDLSSASANLLSQLAGCLTHHHLKNINLSNNQLAESESGREFIIRIFKEGDLTHLNLSDNKLNLFSEYDWRLMLKHLKELTDLNLSHNGLFVCEGEKIAFVRNDHGIKLKMFFEVSGWHEAMWNDFLEGVKHSKLINLDVGYNSLDENKINSIKTCLNSKKSEKEMTPSPSL